MKKPLMRLINKLAKKLETIPEPIHLLAVCSGGLTLSKMINDRLRKAGKKVNYFEVWTNVINGKREVWKSNFTEKEYRGYTVIVEDVIWRGGAIPPIKKMLKQMNPKKRIYIAALLDCNQKADFSVYN